MADMSGGGAGGPEPPAQDKIVSIRQSEWDAMRGRVESLENRMDNLVRSQAETKKTADAVRRRQMIDEPIGGPGNSVTDFEG